MLRYHRYCLCLSVLIMVALAANALSAVSTVEFSDHSINLTIDVDGQEASIRDEGELFVRAGWNLFYLSPEARIASFTIGGEPVDYHVAGVADTSQFPDEVRDELPELEAGGDPLLVFFEVDAADTTDFSITFRARFTDSVENVRFSRENVGREVSGTILERGAYLSPGSYYYPRGVEGMAGFRLTADIPAAWHSVADGNRVSSDTADSRRIEAWVNPYRNDGCMFMAAPYVVRSIDVDGVEVACYFFEADTSLIDGYLEATAQYIEMYSELIGPYPFERFTVAENFFPTGYGMPAWTLLGQQVIRLPFIKSTSLGHEVLHNWWGNSVYVDYERGNWCEGATVYGADYRYKLNESDEAAKAYRKDILKAYASYVDEGNDFPIREFTSRTSAGSRVVGYSKVMMVYHMIEQEIGSEPFWAAWRLVYDRYKTTKISWREWLDAFEETSGQDLSWVIPQWIDRAGAPRLNLGEVKADVAVGEGKQVVKVVLLQASDDVYRLRVPLRFEGGGLVIDTAVVMNSPEGEFEFELPNEIESVEVDPDYHLFRRLHPDEMEPIISAVLGMDKKFFVMENGDDELKAAFEMFGGNLTEDTVVVQEEIDPLSLAPAYGWVLLNPEQMPKGLDDQLVMTDSTISIAGEVFPRAGHTFILSSRNDSRGHFIIVTFIIVMTDDAGSLPRIGQLVPHYGKYSYLVFEGARNVAKGQWLVTGSPLKRTW